MTVHGEDKEHGAKMDPLTLGAGCGSLYIVGVAKAGLALGSK